MTDQQRWDALGVASGWASTPHLDRVAAAGVRFRYAVTNSPVCVPARASLATGRYPHQHGVQANQPWTLPDRPTWMRAVKDAGYATSVFGKTHLHPQRGDLRDRADVLHRQGFDHVDEIAGPRASTRCRSGLTDLWEEAGVRAAYDADLRDRLDTTPWTVRPSPLPLELYPDVYVGRQAAAHLRGLPPDAPWFCWVSFSGPHEPWDAPAPWAGRFDPAAMPPPLPIPPASSGRRPRGRLDRRLARRQVDFAPGDVARLRADYAAKVALIDDQVGGLLEAVAGRGELDRTAVVVVSDHGEMNGDFGLLYKENFLEPAVRVPFVVAPRIGSAPAAGDSDGAGAGRVSPAVVELMDAGATVAELAGAALPERSRARSVLPVVRGDTGEHRDAAVSEYRGEVMAATTRHKVMLDESGTTYRFYDLVEDPHEQHDLVGRRLDRATRRAGKDLRAFALRATGRGG